MITIESMWEDLLEIVPLFSSFTLIALLLLALRDCKTNTERSIKLSFLLYLMAFTAGYLLLTLYRYCSLSATAQGTISCNAQKSDTPDCRKSGEC